MFTALCEPSLTKSRKILIVFVGIYLLAGVVEATIGAYPRESGFVIGLSVAIVIFWWLGAHAKENSVTPPMGSKLLSAFLAPIGLPYYFYSCFGFRRGSFYIITSLLFLVFCVAISEIAAYASTFLSHNK